MDLKKNKSDFFKKAAFSHLFALNLNRNRTKVCTTQFWNLKSTDLQMYLQLLGGSRSMRSKHITGEVV